jgi:hypothetical protein
MSSFVIVCDLEIPEKDENIVPVEEEKSKK